MKTHEHYYKFPVEVIEKILDRAAFKGLDIFNFIMDNFGDRHKYQVDELIDQHKVKDPV